MNKILAKLHAIMSECDYIQKDKKNAHQGYSYASERAIKEALHESLVKNGVVFTLSTSNPRVENGVTWIDCAYRFLDVESSEFVTGTFLGSGSARDEKGHYAAVTGAIKYILTSTFLIPTGDDPEADEQKPKKTATTQPTTAKTIANPATDDQLKMVSELVVDGLGADPETKGDILAKLNARFGFKFTSPAQISGTHARTIIAALKPEPAKQDEPEEEERQLSAEEIEGIMSEEDKSNPLMQM